MLQAQNKQAKDINPNILPCDIPHPFNGGIS